jgi:hypothetical protein
MSFQADPLTLKREKWLDFGRHRVSAHTHTLLHWVKIRFHQKTLPDSLMFCALQWLYWLLGDAEINIKNVTNRDPLSPLVVRELEGVWACMRNPEPLKEQADWLLLALENFHERFQPHIVALLGCHCEGATETSTGYTCGYHVWVADTEAVILALQTKAGAKP